MKVSSTVNKTDGTILLPVPGGRFVASDTLTGEPEFEAMVPAFYIAAYPITNAQYLKFVQDTGHAAPDRFWKSVWKDGCYPAEKADHPVVCVDWSDAHAYCEWAGLRLPGEMEWEKAARGTDGRWYPWGGEWDKDKCRNLFNSYPMNETTAAVSSYAAGASPYGAYHMIGNVLQWCEDWFDFHVYDRYRQGDLTPPSSGEFRVMRGGSWSSGPVWEFHTYQRKREKPGFRDNDVGFRCAM